MSKEFGIRYHKILEKKESTRYYLFMYFTLNIIYIIFQTLAVSLYFDNLSNYFHGALQIEIINYKVAKWIQGIVTVQSIVVNVIIYLLYFF